MARAANLTRSAASPALKVLELKFIPSSSLELGNVGRRSPLAEGGGLKGELAGAVACLVVDHAHAGGVLVGHAVGPFEVEKHGARGGVTARTEANVYAELRQKIVGANEVVDRRDLMIDMLYTAALPGKQGDLVMHGVDPQQRSIADPIAHPRVAGVSPKTFIARRCRRIQAHVGKAGDAGLTGRGIVTAAVKGFGDQIDRGSTGLTEAHERADPAPVAFGGRAGLDRNARGVEFGRGGIERLQIRQF